MLGIIQRFCCEDVKVQKGHVPCLGPYNYHWLTRNLEAADCQALELSIIPYCLFTRTWGFLFELKDLISPVSSVFLSFQSHSFAPHVFSIFCQNIILLFKNFFFFNFYSERERQTQAEGEAGSMQRAWCGGSGSPGSRPGLQAALNR